MDSSLLKTMLESQERAYKTAMEMVVKQMNDHIKQLEGKVSELVTSLQFTQREVDDLKSQNKDHEKERKGDKMKIDKLTEQVDLSNKKLKELEERINYQEDYSRRKNVRITGVEERDGNETWEQTAASVASMLQDKMQLPELVVERAHRVGVRRDGRPRTIVARFSRFCDREAVMRNAKKLKGTNIFLNDDLCPASQAVKNAQMPLLKQAKAQGKIAYFRHTRLIVKERYNNDGAAAGRGQQPAGDAGVAGTMVTGGGGGAESSPVVGDVVGVQAAGVWSSGGAGALPSLNSPRPVGSRAHSPSAREVSLQRKMNLRNTAKK